MNKLEILEDKIYKEKIKLKYNKLPEGLKGLYFDDNIIVDKYIDHNEKVCIIAEELGHYHTATSNILDYSDINKYKEELKGRDWAVKELLPLEKIIKAIKKGSYNFYELAEELEVTEKFLNYSIAYHSKKHSPYLYVDDVLVTFEPYFSVKIK